MLLGFRMLILDLDLNKIWVVHSGELAVLGTFRAQATPNNGSSWEQSL